MPAASVITPTERARQARKLAKEIDGTGLSRREVARQIAEARGMAPTTMEANLKRWTSEKPREGAVDAPPAWVFGAVSNVRPPYASPKEIETALREAIERGYISLTLASYAADAIRAIPRKSKGR